MLRVLKQMLIVLALMLSVLWVEEHRLVEVEVDEASESFCKPLSASLLDDSTELVETFTFRPKTSENAIESVSGDMRIKAIPALTE